MNRELLKTEFVHPKEIKAGDTIVKNNELITIGKKHLWYSDFYQWYMVDGCDYNMNRDKVERQLFMKWKEGKFAGWVTQP